MIEEGEAGEGADDELGQDSEEVPEEDLPDAPVFMQEKEPEGEENRAKYWLLKGMSDEDIATAKSINPSTIRIARSHLMRDGYMKKERKQPKGKKVGAEVAVPAGKGMQIFAKGAPPEAIIENIKVPMIVDGQTEIFETGMKFGLSIVVLGVRVAQELAGIQGMMVKPVIDLTRSVREGEGTAFKAGADEAAFKSAQAIGSSIMPMMAGLEAKVSEMSKTSGQNPMQGMMVRMMEPIMTGLMGKLIPGMGGGAAGGWTKKSE